MQVIDGLKYSKDHEWLKVGGNKAYVGITDYAQHALGSIVFIELPSAGEKLNAGDVLGVVESVKVASDIYSPVSGVILEVNEELACSPEKINAAPYESWMALIELTDVNELVELMDTEAYRKIV